jgi:hypothetical protein
MIFIAVTTSSLFVEAPNSNGGLLGSVPQAFKLSECVGRLRD